MLKDFTKLFDEMVSTRVEDIDSNIMIENTEYREMQEELIELHSEIKEYLPEESKKLIDKYEQANGLLQALSENVIYEQGVKDGIKIKNMLRSVV